jgi:anti-sigma regulatory factor (Ser/Thr protein kinase)
VTDGPSRMRTVRRPSRRRLRAELPPDLHAAERGRALVAPLLGDVSADERWRVEVLLSELLTNAVLHGPSETDELVRLRIEAEEGRLHVEVEDGGAGVPEGVAELPAPWRTHGRGLALVRGLADRWGIDRDPSRVWFELELGRTGAAGPRRPAPDPPASPRRGRCSG